ncbi:MAG: DUF805 domain-containing protein [Caulobacteraceae bacterium]|nr:DUF805 domain-containing protein [Caulobacteraceae bacterium]
MELMFQPLRKYADFQGRARRSEYWLFVLFEFLLMIAFLVVFTVVAAAAPRDQSGQVSGMATGIGGGLAIVGLLLFLALLVPRLAVLVRRLHDSGNSGWLALLVIVPFGAIVLLVFTLLDGTAGPNTYGPDPKGRGQPRVADTFS